MSCGNPLVLTGRSYRAVANRLALERAAHWADAAPDLLAALEELTGDYAGGAERASDDPYIIERALAAIARAKGDTK